MKRMATRMHALSASTSVTAHVTITIATTAELSWAITTGWALPSAVGVTVIAVGVAEVVVGAAVTAAVVHAVIIWSWCEVGMTSWVDVSSTSAESLKQWGESRAGIVSPHGPGDMKYPPPRMVIWTLLPLIVRVLARPSVKAVRFNGGSLGMGNLTLKTT